MLHVPRPNYIFYFYWSVLAPNYLTMAGSQFFPYRLKPKEIKTFSNWEQLGLNLGLLAPQAIFLTSRSSLLRLFDLSQLCHLVRETRLVEVTVAWSLHLAGDREVVRSGWTLDLGPSKPTPASLSKSTARTSLSRSKSRTSKIFPWWQEVFYSNLGEYFINIFLAFLNFWTYPLEMNKKLF